MTDRVWVIYTKSFKHPTGARFAGERRFETAEIAGLMCSCGVAESTEFETGEQPAGPFEVQPDTGALGQQANQAGG